MWLLIQNTSLFFASPGFDGWQLSLLSLLIFVVVTAFIFLVKYLGILIIVLLERKLQNGRVAIWVNVMEKVKPLLVIINGLFYASLVWELPLPIKESLTIFYVLMTVVFFTDVLRLAVADSIKFYFQMRGNVSNENIQTVVNFTNVVSTIVFGFVAVIILLQVSNVDAQALLGGFGIASVIIAFSFQNALRDIFAFFSIYLDRTFEVGDYVVFDKYEGTIKEIRMRSTRIKALKGNDIIISNDKLINGVVQNFSRVQWRRVSFNFKLEPTLEEKKVAELLKLLREIFEKEDISNRVMLSSLTLDQVSERGLSVNVVYRFTYQLKEPDNFQQHLLYRERINLAILQLLNEKKVSFMQNLGTEAVATG